MRHRASQLRHSPAFQGFKAFTLVESLVAASLVGVAAVAFCSALRAGTSQNEQATRYVVATNLATALMNEIVSRSFYDGNTPLSPALGPGAGETTRSLYDNFDDFHGLTEASGSLCAADGTALSDPSLAGFSRKVTAAYVNIPGRDARLPSAFILVTVEVKHNGMSLVTLKRLISSQERG